MKKEKQNDTLLTITNAIDKKLEMDLKQMGEEGNMLASENAKDNASLNLPKQDSPNNPFFGPITAFFNKGIGLIKSTLSGFINKFNEAEAKVELQEQTDALKKEVQGINNIIRLKNREKQKKEERGLAPVKKEKRWRRLRIFNLFVILLDVVISSSAFQSIGYSMIVSSAIGFGVGIAVYLLSDHLPEIVEKGRTIAQRWLIGISMYVGLTAVFYVIGSFRSQGFSSGSVTQTSPWYFVCLNLFFYTVASVVALLNKPNKTEKKQLDNWHTLIEEIQTLQKNKKGIEAQITKLHKDFNDKKDIHEKAYRYASDLEILVNSMYQDSIHTYITTNIQNRSDAIIPDCFSEQAPSLTFYFNTDTP